MNRNDLTFDIYYFEKTHWGARWVWQKEITGQSEAVSYARDMSYKEQRLVRALCPGKHDSRFMNGRRIQNVK